MYILSKECAGKDFLLRISERLGIDTSVPGQRAPGQRLLNFPAKENFIAMLDNALERCGYSNRAEFIRDAIVEKLESLEIKVDRRLALAPGRRRPKSRKPTKAINSTTDPLAAGVLDDCGEHALKHEAVPGPGGSSASSGGKKRAAGKG